MIDFIKKLIYLIVNPRLTIALYLATKARNTLRMAINMYAYYPSDSFGWQFGEFYEAFADLLCQISMAFSGELDNEN